MRTKFFLIALASVALLIPQNEAKAQINWSPSVDLFAGGDNADFISQNGTFVFGINSGGATTTVGDSLFTGFGTPSNPLFLQTQTTTQNGITFAGGFDETAVGAFDTGPFSDAGVAALLPGAIWDHTFDPAASTPTVSFSGLTPGYTYEIQVLVNDARSFGAGIRDTAWEVAFTNGSDDLVAVTADLNNRAFNDMFGDANYGDFVIGSFVADTSGIQSFDMSATRGNDQTQTQFVVGQSIDLAANGGTPSPGQVQINALQLRVTAVPEPSSSTLLGLALIAGMMRRRR